MLILEILRMSNSKTCCSMDSNLEKRIFTSCRVSQPERASWVDTRLAGPVHASGQQVAADGFGTPARPAQERAVVIERNAVAEVAHGPQSEKLWHEQHDHTDKAD